MPLTPRFDAAFAYAHEVHRDHTRKGNGFPYIGHLMGVASIVIDDGGTEDEAIAALLHDAPEDRVAAPAWKKSARSSATPSRRSSKTARIRGRHPRSRGPSGRRNTPSMRAR